LYVAEPPTVEALGGVGWVSNTIRCMRLSVIIPALNESAQIEAAVNRAWELDPHEVIVADGGSTDGTAAIARSAGASVVSSERGRSIQQNAGATAASGNALLFLHADCWLEAEATDQIRQWFQSTSIPAAAFHQRIEDDGLIYRLLEIGNSLRICMTRLAFGDQGILIRREVFESLGGFPDAKLMEDVLLMRLIRQLGRVQLLSGPLHVDARRWQKHGPVRQTIRNFCLLSAEQLGVSPNKLANLYLPHWLNRTKSIEGKPQH
jgi:rSAM/selenodomain-associated transferase 2